MVMMMILIPSIFFIFFCNSKFVCSIVASFFSCSDCNNNDDDNNDNRNDNDDDNDDDIDDNDDTCYKYFPFF